MMRSSNANEKPLQERTTGQGPAEPRSEAWEMNGDGGLLPAASSMGEACRGWRKQAVTSGRQARRTVRSSHHSKLPPVSFELRCLHEARPHLCEGSLAEIEFAVGREEASPQVTLTIVKTIHFFH